LASRLAPLEEPFPPEVARAIEAMNRVAPAPREPNALFRLLARNLPLARGVEALGTALLGPGASAPARERELVVLRACARARCAYDWGMHAALFAPAAGLGRAEIERTATDAGAWSAQDAPLAALADELHATDAVSDATWDALAARFAPAVLLELVVAAGFYRLVSWVANAARLPPEPWAASFPDRP